MNNGIDKQRKALGRGLSALLPTRPSAPAAGFTAAAAMAPVIESTPNRLPIDSIQANPLQPRTVFEPAKLEELAASIRANGVIQPIVVRKFEGGFQIVAGERRWRASKLAGLADVPVVVQDVADPQMLELALIENIQREDLNPVETAQAYDRLSRELGLSQEEIGRRTGKDRTSIANTIRLLKLPKEIQLLLAEHRLSMGHARAILGLPEAEQQILLAEKAAAQGLSVRQVETMVQEMTADRPNHGGGSPSRKDSNRDPNVRAAAEELERLLGTRVRIVELSEQRGRIEIEYYSQAELERIYDQLSGKS
jgi:ParB family chromosome partitioning protein